MSVTYVCCKVNLNVQNPLRLCLYIMRFLCSLSMKLASPLIHKFLNQFGLICDDNLFHLALFSLKQWPLVVVDINSSGVDFLQAIDSELN